MQKVLQGSFNLTFLLDMANILSFYNLHFKQLQTALNPNTKLVNCMVVSFLKSWDVHSS